MTLRGLAREIAASLDAAGIPDARIEAEMIVRHAAGVSRTAYFTGAEATPAATDAANALACRRLKRVPLAYLIGTREFYGLEFGVTPDVLIPRPESEALVEFAIAELSTDPAQTVVDIGTGSGCLAVSIAHTNPRARVLATERSAAALRIARSNARLHDVRVDFIRGDLLAPVGRADIMVANLPYIPSDRIATLQPEVRDHEPVLALDGGPDGLDLITRLIADCGKRLRPRLLALEVDCTHAEQAASLARQRGAKAEVHRDFAGLDRYVVARWP